MTQKKQAGFWGNLLGLPAPRDKYSLEELRHLHDVLRSNSEVTDQNRGSVVEALRAISELMIWGDQHDPRFFDFFLENNLMRHFTAFLEKPANRKGDVAKQVLQTLYILIQNLRSQTALYYVCSNNHVNDLVVLAFDFEDEEVLGYYINLLKSISLRLTPKTAQFFFMKDGEQTSLPLYTEAVKLFNHRDGMVRAAVRTLTLQTYALEDEGIQKFLVSQPASNFLNEVAIIIAEKCQALDRKLSVLEAGTSQAANSVESELCAIEDLLSYANDVLNTGTVELSQLFMQHLWESFVKPILVEPLQQLANPEDRRSLLPLCSLCILERLLHVVAFPQLANSVACALVFPPQIPSSSPFQVERRWQPQGSCKDGFLEALRCGDTVVAAAAVRVVLALIQNRAVDPDILDSCGLLPDKRRKKRELLNMLTADSTAASVEAVTPSSRSDDDAMAPQRRESSNEGMARSQNGSRRPEPPEQVQTHHRRRVAGKGEWVEALFSLLLLEVLPCTALWVAGHLLLLLVARPEKGPAGSAAQQRYLATSLKEVRAAFAREVSGVWTEVLPVLVAQEWERAAAGLSAGSLKNCMDSVQAWMQAIQAQKLSVEAGSEGTEGARAKSARAAAVATHTVQRLAALAQIQLSLSGASQKGDPPLPIPLTTEVEMKQGETREHMEMALQRPAGCTVSFARGAERSVMFAVHGVPQVDRERASGLTPEEKSLVAASSPCVLLASRTHIENTGVVLSVAPLIGADPCVDKSHKRWLHIHVRPHARGMLKTVRGSGLGEAVHQLEQQLVDGHWVLAFETPALAESAMHHIQKQADVTKELFKEVLRPMIQPRQEG